MGIGPLSVFCRSPTLVKNMISGLGYGALNASYQVRMLCLVPSPGARSQLCPTSNCTPFARLGCKKNCYPGPILAEIPEH